MQVTTVDIREAIVRFLAANAPIIQFVSYIVSPVLALIAFWWNRRDRKALAAQAQDFGQLKTEVSQAQQIIGEQRRDLQNARQQISAREGRVASLERDLRKITEGSQELWKLRDASAFPEYVNWLRDPRGAKLITIGNLKGGVGKTTLAANLAAYISETRQKRVLLIDLDYQGSLSNMLMLAIEKEQVESKVDRLFAANAELATIEAAKVHLVPKINRGWLLPASYTFAQLENQLLLKWLLQDDGGVDVRFRLARVLLNPNVRQNYEAIILDMPPRMTLGSINALVASHAFVVPTVLDALSVEAVGQFLTNMKAIKKDLELDIELAGIAGVMTRAMEPSVVERRGLELAKESGKLWKNDATDYVFRTTLPRKVDIANAAGVDIAYFGRDSEGPLKRLFDPLFEEICTVVWKGDGP